MSNRLSRLASLSGVLFALLGVAAAVSGGETPEANASAAKVIAYYTSHRSEVETSSILFALTFLVGVLFAASLRSYLRRTPAAEGAAAIIPVGAGIMAIGAALGGGVEHGLAHNLSHLSPSAAQAVNVVSNEIFFPLLVGVCVFSLASGVAILRGAALPKWLGWVAIVMGIAAVIPPAFFPVVIVLVLWSITVSILIYRRSGAPTETPATSPRPDLTSAGTAL
jgi:hypothetical protein